MFGTAVVGTKQQSPWLLKIAHTFLPAQKVDSNPATQITPPRNVLARSHISLLSLSQHYPRKFYHIPHASNCSKSIAEASRTTHRPEIYLPSPKAERERDAERPYAAITLRSPPHQPSVPRPKSLHPNPLSSPYRYYAHSLRKESQLPVHSAMPSLQTPRHETRLSWPARQPTCLPIKVSQT